MNKMTFDHQRRIAEDAEVAAVLATIEAPATLELEPMHNRPHAPQSRVLLNAVDVMP
ncbi:MAG: hypothetical protein V4641_05785 [Pseudomonadota bacterium]